MTFCSGNRTSIQVYDVTAIMSGAPCEPIAQFTLPFDCKVKRAAWGPLNDSIYLACDDGFVRRFSNPIQVSVVVVVVVMMMMLMMMLMMMNVDVHKHVSALHTASEHKPTHPPASQDGPDTEQMRPPRSRSMDEPDFKSACTDMTFSYDGTRFIVTSTDQTAKLYDACANTPPPPPFFPPPSLHPLLPRLATSSLLTLPSSATRSKSSQPSRATARFTPPQSPPTAATRHPTTSLLFAEEESRRLKLPRREVRASLRRCSTTRCTRAMWAASS